MVKRIRESATTELQKQVLDDGLLTVLCHGDVQICSKKDETKTLICRGAELPDKPTPFLLRPDVHSLPDPSDLSSSTDQQEAPWSPEIFQYCPKAHYRIVFQEVAESIDNLTSAREILLVLRQTLKSACICFTTAVEAHLQYPQPWSCYMNWVGFIGMSARATCSSTGIWQS